MGARERSVHLVGSIPAESTDEAMTQAMARVGPALRSLPDGETGERRNWIVNIIQELADHPDLELARPGDWSDYDHASRLRIRRGHRLDGDRLDFGHVAAFETAYPIFSRLRDEHDRAELAFQVGVPGDLDMALFTLGPVGAFVHRRAFAEATAREVATIHEKVGDDAVFQIEIPAELVFVARMPGPLRPLMARFLSGGVADLVRRTPPGARFGIHLCLGDLGNKALGRMNDAGPLVTLLRALLRVWPDDRGLEYVHVPFAAGDEPSPLEEAFYRPLSRLSLPADVRLVAGFVHEQRSIEELRRTRDVIEAQAGRPVDVATACGLGRRTTDSGQRLMGLCADMATDDEPAR